MKEEKKIWGTLDPFFEDGPVLGRTVANETFIKALLRADPFDEYHFFLFGKNQVETIKKRLAKEYPELEKRGAFYCTTREHLANSLTCNDYYCFHLSDFIDRHVAVEQLRNKYSRRIFPVTSVTHSLSYNDFMESFLKHFWEGTTRRDAIIATSRCARTVLESIFSSLRTTYTIPRNWRTPTLAIIPLGVEANVPSVPKATIAALRQKIGLTDRPTTVFLCFSRISAQSKMDFLPVLAACRRAEALGLETTSFCLVLAGWVEENDPLPDALSAMAKSMGIHLAIIPRPTNEERDALYEIAHIFLSPADNIQETFGLTVLEAGAHGLAVIASDFNGYKDTVLHNITGLLIPAVGFAVSAETNTLSSVWMHNQYHLKLAQEVAIDVPELAGAMALLAQNEKKRQLMGEAAKTRVMETFDWSVIIQQYCDLWQKLWEEPISESERTCLRAANHPTQMDFANFFSGHFSRRLIPPVAESMWVKRTPLGEAYYKGVMQDLPYAGLEHMMDKDTLHKLLFLTRESILVKNILSELKKDTEQKAALPDSFLDERAAFPLLWALKHDLIEVSPPKRE